MTDYRKIAALLFPQIHKTPEDYAAQYPARSLPEGAAVTRFAPSPTGFIHIGAVYAAMIAQRLARQSGGVFYLRIEDTDKKREVEDGIAQIVRGLEAFGIVADEGFVPGGETGAYGPYQQSHRGDIYQCYAKDLVERGLAYPCFCTEEDLNSVREKQEAQKLRTGYYGAFAHCRELSDEEIENKVRAETPFVLRLKSPGREDRRISFADKIKGKIEMPENDQDLVLLKRDGIPTYHFAHAVDDHLMGTTLVVRGDEWISSTPIHMQLFQALGFKPPKYAHIAPIMKEENGSKRKLSKRKDPEAAVLYYYAEGYPAASVLEYLDTISNSNFEDWRRANPAADRWEFPFQLSKMSQSGALFDLNKLNDVSKNCISRMTAREVYEGIASWAREYDPAFAALLEKDPDYAKAILSIDRGGSKPRKDLAKWADAKAYMAYFYQELYQPDYTLPEQVAPADAAAVLAAYEKVYDPEDDKEAWFAKVKALCEPLGFSPDVKAYKKDPSGFKGHVGDLSTVIRIAVTSRRNTPDLCAIMGLLGRDACFQRLRAAKEYYQSAGASARAGVK